jgi:hypothetical protein
MLFNKILFKYVEVMESFKRLTPGDSLPVRSLNDEVLCFQGTLVCSPYELDNFNLFKDTKLSRSFSKQFIEFEHQRDGPDLRSHFNLVRNQLDSPLSVPFAICSAIEYFVRASTGQFITLSPQFLFDQREDRSINCIKVSECLQIAEHLGTCLEATHPFGCDYSPSTKAVIQAKEYRIYGFSLIQTADEAKLALRGGCIPILVLPVYNTTTSFWKQRKGDKFLGMHTVTIVGFTEYGFILRSSFGISWGIKGNSLDFGFEEWDDVKIECWSISPMISYPRFEERSRPRKKKKCSIM